MKHNILFIFIAFISVGLYADNETFYYYKGIKISLQINRNLVNVLPSDGSIVNSSGIISRHFDVEGNISSASGNLVKLKFKTIPEQSEYIKITDSLVQTGFAKKVFPFFMRNNGASPIGTSNIFYLKLKDTKDSTLLTEKVKTQNVHIIKRVPYLQDWYILSIQNSMFKNALEASNYFYETGLFAEVDPAFMFDFAPNCVNDPSFNQLWGLSNSNYPNVDIKACQAWGISKGNGIKVAVVDQGIHTTHGDLSANIYPLSFDAESGTSPSIFTSGLSHGTHVAGTVAAEGNNNLQIVGVAYNAKLIPISHKLDATQTISAELASGITWAWQNGADIITNSWGDKGGVLYGYLHSTVLENAIINAMTLGRNGKGCIVTFASGNRQVMDYPAYFDNRILTVGAIQANGTRASFSGHGNELDVVAPGVNILSTIPNNATGTMNGTSMACPHVAGVAALVLSANPSLTAQQVRDIIEKTAQKVGGYSYQTVSGRPNGTWNQQMGYGLVNAYAAVQAATACVNSYTDQTVTTNTSVTGCDALTVKNVIVKNGAKLTLTAPDSITINGNFEVETGAQLEVN